MRYFLSLACLFALTGCMSTSQYGNFATATPVINQKLATDTVKQLVALYPPASTRFTLIAPTPDTYGQTLLSSLRAKGYSIVEFNAGPSSQLPLVAARSEGPDPATAYASSVSLALGYVIDTAPGSSFYRVGSATDTGLYRVTVLVGKQSLTRAYLLQNNTVYPAGAWARKE